MPIDPNAIGAKTKPHIFEWTDRDTLLYALGVGAGTQDLAFTTENSHDIPQQVLPTYAVIACLPFAAAGKIGKCNFAMLLHGSQEIRLHKPLPPAGKLSVVAEVADIQDKGEGKNAIVMLKATGTDPDTSDVIAETLTTAVIRGEGISGATGRWPGCPPKPPSPRITAVVNVSAMTSDVSGSVPVAFNMTIAFLPSPLSWMSATSATTLSLPVGGSGLCSRISWDPCRSMAKLNLPILPAAAKGRQAMTA